MLEFLTIMRVILDTGEIALIPFETFADCSEALLRVYEALDASAATCIRTPEITSSPVPLPRPEGGG